MLNRFHPNNVILFKLNGEPYMMHKYILGKLDVFKVLDDCPGQSVELVWNILPKDAETIFAVLAGDNNLMFDDDSVIRCLQIISFIKYIGAETDVIDVVMSLLLRNKTFVNYLYECNSLSYDVNMNDILKVIPVKFDNEDIDVLLHMVKSNDNFDVDFKFILVKEMYYADMVQLKLKTGWACKLYPRNLKTCDVHQKCMIGKIEHIHNYFDYYNFPIQCHSLHFEEVSDTTIIPLHFNMFIDDIEIKICRENDKNPILGSLAQYFSELFLSI